MGTGSERKPSEHPLGMGTWVARLMKAARTGAPSLRTLLTADVELHVMYGSTKEFARGATIVSEWLAGRIAMAQHVEGPASPGRSPRIVAQINFGSDPRYPAIWHLEAVLTPEGTARELTLRTQGSA